MKVEIKVPAAGESVSEAIVAAIFKESGTFVKRDEEILELETDKVNQVVHSPESGVLTLTVSVEEVVKPEQVIGNVDTDATATATKSTKEVVEEKKVETPAVKEEKSSKQEQVGARQSIDSFVDSLSEERSVERKEQIRPTAKEKQPSSAPSFLPETGGEQTRKRMSGLRKTIAKRLVEAKNTTAMLTTFNEVDMSAVMEIRQREKDSFLQKHEVKLGFMSFFVKACVAALKEIPTINAFIDGDEIVFNSSYNVGISVSTEKGLMVPVLRNCEACSFAVIEKKIQEFAKKARSGSIAVDDLKGGTFTITNGGVFGSMLSTPILNPPQSAILGMHSITERPIAIDKKVVIRPMMYLALSYDHRIVDGKEAITFLGKVKEVLEKPDRLLFDF